MSNRETTRRRDVLRTAGAAAGALSLTALAGCSTEGGEGEGEEEGGEDEDEETGGDEEDVAAADESAETDIEAAAGPQ